MKSICVRAGALLAGFGVLPALAAEPQRAVGGDGEYHSVQFYTASTVAADGSPLYNREDGLYFQGRRLDTAGGKLRQSGSSLCQREGLAFYSTLGKPAKLYQVSLQGGVPELIFTLPDPGPEAARTSISPVSVMADCSRLVIGYAAWPASVANRTEAFHGDFAQRRAEILYSAIYLGERDALGRWSFREVLREQRWLSHPDIEPLEGRYLAYTWDGSADKVTPHIMDLASGEIRAMHDDAIAGRLIHPFWLGDGRHLGAIHWTSGPVSLARLDVTRGDFRELEVPGNWNLHEVSGRTLANGHALILADGKVKGKPAITTGPILLGEIDYDAGRFVSFREVARYGPRYARDNKTLPSDEGWFPHPNISQDGRFAAWTSSNGRSEKGSDVFVLPLP